MATNNDENDWQKLPSEQKVQHKAWKARLTGYEECAKLFHAQGSDQSPEFNKYLPLMKKFVTDANENAREKALEAVLAFVEEAQVAGKTVSDVAPGVIGKCLNARTKMKERAFEILLMFIEIEKHVEIEEELIKGLENKQPKIVQACLEVLRKGLSDFGSKVLPIKPFLKQVIPLLEDRDKSIRDEAKLLLVEVYRWIGKQTLMPMIQNVKPIQMQELQVEFDKLDASGSDKPRPTRFLRSQQDLREKYAQIEEGATAAVGPTTDEMNIDMHEDLDPFELIEPVNIIERLSKDFYSKIESKQWKDRKEALDELLNLLTQNPRPASDTDYNEFIKTLRKIIAKDSNIPVVCTTAKCLTGLAKGLRMGFRNYAVAVTEVCLDRCREKKSNVIEALRETCDAAYLSTNLEQLAEAIVAVLGHKTPIVRQCSQQFLTRCFAMSSHATLPKKVLKMYLPALIKNTAEADPTVRDSAFESLGMLWKCLGEKHVLPNLTDLDELKMTKIKEYAEKAILLNLRGEPRSASAPLVIPIVVLPEKRSISSPSTEVAATKPAPKPVPIVKKKPLVVAKSVPTPPEPIEEKKKEAVRPAKPTVIRAIPPRTKPPLTTVSNGKVPASKTRPATAPVPPKAPLPQSRTQHLIPIVAAPLTKSRLKPLTSNTRRSLTAGPSPALMNASASNSNLQRQSTSTGGSTSSLSSTNTQASIPCIRSDTPTSSNSISLLRSVSNDVIASPVSTSASLAATTKSRIPVRAIPIPIGKKSST